MFSLLTAARHGNVQNKAYETFEGGERVKTKKQFRYGKKVNVKITHGKFPTSAKKLKYGKLPT